MLLRQPIMKLEHPDCNQNVRYRSYITGPRNSVLQWDAPWPRLEERRRKKKELRHAASLLRSNFAERASIIDPGLAHAPPSSTPAHTCAQDPAGRNWKCLVSPLASAPVRVLTWARIAGEFRSSSLNLDILITSHSNY